MRSTSPPERDNWATYIRGAREALGMTKAEFARRISVDRGTVHRWETGSNRVEDPLTLRRIAHLIGRPFAEVLAAVGIAPAETPPPEPPAPEPDPELDLIRHANIPAERKKQLIRWVLQRRERERQARMEDLRHIVGEP